MSISRRKFIRNIGTTAILTPLTYSPFAKLEIRLSNDDLDVHLFSKQIQFLNLKEAGKISAELGFDGLDLTVRPEGHVSPENVEADLPKAIQDIKEAGSSCKMITTAISDVDKVKDLNIIKVAAKEGLKFYRMDWYKYPKGENMKESIDEYQQKIKRLGEVNKLYGIIGCYQNHAGTNVGSSFWEVNQLLETVNPDYFGVQYDVRHAMVEGGLSWKNGLQLLKNQIKTIVLKDFRWEKVNGKWEVVNVPIGEGMVDFKGYFKILKEYGLTPPASLHLEYPLGGAEKGNYEISIDKNIVFDAMKKDLDSVRHLWKEA